MEKLPLETGDTLQNPPDLVTIAGYSSGIEQARELYLVSRLGTRDIISGERPLRSKQLRHVHLVAGPPRFSPTQTAVELDVLRHPRMGCKAQFR